MELLLFALIPMGVFGFFYSITAMIGDPNGPRHYKIEHKPTRFGDMYFVYEHLGWPTGWSWTSCYSSASLEGCEAWIKRAKKVSREPLYR